MKVNYYKDGKRTTKIIGEKKTTTIYRASRYERVTVDKWKYDVIALGFLLSSFFCLMMALKIYDLEGRNITHQVHASEQNEKEIEIAEQVSGFNDLLQSPEPSSKPAVKTITLKVSHYWPALGGVNCSVFMNGECVSKMANGQRWQDHVEEAIACPKELSFGTKIKVLGEVWTCMDRGGAIKKVGDTYWIDMLTPNARIGYGTVVEGEIL